MLMGPAEQKHELHSGPWFRFSRIFSCSCPYSSAYAAALENLPFGLILEQHSKQQPSSEVWV